MVIDKFIHDFINKAQYDNGAQAVLRVDKEGVARYLLLLRSQRHIEKLFKPHQKEEAREFGDKIGQWFTALINKELAKHSSDQKAEDFLRRTIEAYNERVGDTFKFRFSKQETDLFTDMMKDFADQQIIMTDVKLTLAENENRDLKREIHELKNKLDGICQANDEMRDRGKEYAERMQKLTDLCVAASKMMARLQLIYLGKLDKFGEPITDVKTIIHTWEEAKELKSELNNLTTI